MMKKYRLNAAGAQRLQQKLYRGKDSVLQDEAHHVGSDLIGWTEKWFYLHATQADYLEIRYTQVRSLEIRLALPIDLEG